MFRKTGGKLFRGVILGLVVLISWLITPSAHSGRIYRRPMSTESALTLEKGELELGTGFQFGHDTRPVDISLLPVPAASQRKGLGTGEAAVFTWAASVALPLDHKVILIAEASGHPATRRPGVNDFAEFRLGTILRLGQYINWDLAGILGIGPASPNWGITTGLTFPIGHFKAPNR